MITVMTDAEYLMVPNVDAPRFYNDIIAAMAAIIEHHPNAKPLTHTPNKKDIIWQGIVQGDTEVVYINVTKVQVNVW